MFLCWPHSSPGNVSVPCPSYLPWINEGNILIIIVPKHRKKQTNETAKLQNLKHSVRNSGHCSHLIDNQSVVYLGRETVSVSQSPKIFQLPSSCDQKQWRQKFPFKLQKKQNVLLRRFMNYPHLFFYHTSCTRGRSGAGDYPSFLGPLHPVQVASSLQADTEINIHPHSNLPLPVGLMWMCLSCVRQPKRLK